MYIFLHVLLEHVLKPLLSPTQLSLRSEAFGFWQLRILVWTPVPHDNVQELHADQTVQPTGKYKKISYCMIIQGLHPVVVVTFLCFCLTYKT